MPKKENKEKEKFKFILVIVCKGCGTETKVPEPCSKCGKMVFVREYHLIEIEK